MQVFIQVFGWGGTINHLKHSAPWGALPKESFEIYTSEVVSGGFCGPGRFVADFAC